MGIMSKRDVLIKRCGKSLLWSPALHLRRTRHFSHSITSSRYHVATAKTQQRFSSHCCTCIIMRIPPTTVMQLLRSLEIPMPQIIIVKKPYTVQYNVIYIIKNIYINEVHKMQYFMDTSDRHDLKHIKIKPDPNGPWH